MTVLSPRHKQIIVLVGRDGLTYSQVGIKLGISEHTVRNHVKVIVARARTGKPPRTVLSHLYHQLARELEARNAKMAR